MVFPLLLGEQRARLDCRRIDRGRVLHRRRRGKGRRSNDEVLLQDHGDPC